MCRWYIVWHLVWACGTVSAVTAQEYFGAPMPFSIYNLPTAFAVGDIQNDGQLDIVAVGKSETVHQGFVAIIFGKGDGSFVSRTDLPSEYFPTGVAVEDIDRDGLSDIVTVNAVVQSMSLYTNQGNGSFKLKDQIKIKGEPKGLTIGDFNKDGAKDIVVLMQGGRELQFFKGTGKAQFKYGGSWTADAPVRDFVFGDFAESGYDVLAIVHEDESYVILLTPAEKSGKWTFTTTKIDMHTRPVLARLADIDGDGFHDAVTLDGGSLRLVRSETSGLLLDQVAHVKLAEGSAAFELGDFNQDGRNDVAILNPMTAQVQLFINHSTVGAARVAVPTRVAVLYDRDDTKQKMVDVGMLSTFPHVNMSLFDGNGRLIRKYFDFDSGLPDGQFTLEWNGTDENDAEVPDGQYIFYYKLGSLTVMRPLQKP